MVTEKQNLILKIMAETGIIRPSMLRKQGISPQILQRLYRSGRLIRLGRGLYASIDYQPTEYHSFAEVGTRIPKGVICLLSALQFHDLTTQMPGKVWVAIKRPSRPLRIDIPVHIVYFSSQAFSEGIEKHNIEGVEIKVYCPAKTVADCFKYRNKIGLDAAIEALRDCLRQKKSSIDEIWKYAKICRVTNIMKPYLESAL